MHLSHFCYCIFFEKNIWIAEWDIERFLLNFSPTKSKVLDCKSSLTILHLQFKYNFHIDLPKMGMHFDWKIICRKQWRIEWTTRWSLLKSGHKLTFSFADCERKSQVLVIFGQSSCCILLCSQPITWVKNCRQLHAYCEEIYVFILLIMWMNWGQTIIENETSTCLWPKLKRSFKASSPIKFCWCFLCSSITTDCLSRIGSTVECLLLMNLSIYFNQKKCAM